MTTIDPDLEACLCYNSQSFAPTDIDAVLAVVEGEHDGLDWHWLIRLRDGRYACLTGGCDYTGWDCQSSATSTIHESLDAAIHAVPMDDSYDRPIQSLIRAQLDAGKHVTHAERLDVEFGR